MHKDSPIIPIISRINPIPRIIYLRSFLILFSHQCQGLPNGLFPVGVGLPVKILKAFLSSSILATWPAQLNLHPDYIRWTVQPVELLIAKSLTVKPSLLPIRVPLKPTKRNSQCNFYLSLRFPPKSHTKAWGASGNLWWRHLSHIYLNSQLATSVCLHTELQVGS